MGETNLSAHINPSQYNKFSDTQGDNTLSDVTHKYNNTNFSNMNTQFNNKLDVSGIDHMNGSNDVSFVNTSH